MSEFLIGLLLSLVSITATFGLLRTEWNRVHCAYLTFEAVHARMIGSFAKPGLNVRIQEGPTQVEGQGICGEAREHVELPWLEDPV